MPARAQVEALLKARKLDVTLSTGPAEPARPARPTGIDWLDAQMAGGWPQGESSEIAGPASSGRTAVLCATLAAATARGEIVALVDALDRFDPPSGAQAGIALSQMLWARGTPPAPNEPARASRTRVTARDDDAMRQAVERAVKAFGLILQAGGFAIVVLDLADVPPRVVSRLPFTTWMRLQRCVEGAETAALLVVSEPVGRSARGISLRLSLDPQTTPVWEGESDRSRRLTGVALSPAVSAARRLDHLRDRATSGS